MGLDWTRPLRVMLALKSSGGDEVYTGLRLSLDLAEDAGWAARAKRAFADLAAVEQEQLTVAAGKWGIDPAYWYYTKEFSC